MRTDIPWEPFLKHYKPILAIMGKIVEERERGNSYDIILVPDNASELHGAVVMDCNVVHDPNIWDEHMYLMNTKLTWPPVTVAKDIVCA